METAGANSNEISEQERWKDSKSSVLIICTFILL